MNPRPQVLRYASGKARAGRDADVAIVQHVLRDLDFPRDAQLDAPEVAGLLDRIDAYYQDAGWLPPVGVMTGRGYHLLSALRPIAVADVPDIRARLRRSHDDFVHALGTDLSCLGVRVDRTDDLRRMIKLPGVAKPDVGIISSFSGKERVPDEGLRAHLLAYTIAATDDDASGVLIARPATLVLPSWFDDLLQNDAHVRLLWEGNGKTGGDQSTSGYDFSLVQAIAKRGRKNPDDLAVILALRPTGGVARGKGWAYVQRTVSKALRDRARYDSQSLDGGRGE